MEQFSRRSYLATVAGVAIAGCAGRLESAANGDAADGRTDESGVDGGPPTTSRGLPRPADTAVIADAMEPGAAKDAIPSIDDPSFVTASEGDAWLEPGDPVFGIERGGDAKAYPQQVLVWHEIVNDRIGGDRVAVTYCPLTGTAQGFERGNVEFGVSGQLVNSNLVLYDRATDSYWSQMLATGITGPHEGDELIECNVTWTTWKRWRAAHPKTDLLSADTGFARDYGRDSYGSYNPPGGYYAEDHLLFPKFGDDGTDSDPKAVVLGARTADGALAVFKNRLADAGVIEVEIGGVPHVVVHDPDLDTGWVYRNPDRLAIEDADAGIVVDDTTHPPEEVPLTSVIRYDSMWFAWDGYYPDSVVVS